MKPSWSDYYLGIAEAASVRSSCTRRKVGAVVVDSTNRIASVGYNDSPAGEPGCESCPRALSSVPHGSRYDTGPGRCVSLHAELNALLYADRHRLIGGTAYITTNPCPDCEKALRGAGIVRVVWPDGEIDYRKEDACRI